MTQTVHSSIDTNIFSLLNTAHQTSNEQNHWLITKYDDNLLMSSADEDEEDESEDKYDYDDDETQESMEWSEMSSERGSHESDEDYEERMEDLDNFSDRF